MQFKGPNFWGGQLKTKKLIGVALFLGLVSLMAAAQEGSNSKAEIFGGYQYTKFDGGLNANGFNGAVTGKLNRWFGVTADFSGAYGSQSGVDTKTYTYTFGPQISMHSGKVTPFAHALFGGVHESASATFAGTTTSASASGFARPFHSDTITLIFGFSGKP